MTIKEKRIPCRIVVVGATSCIARHCVHLWLKSNDAELFLIGRDENSLQRMANDLSIRYPKVQIKYFSIDLCNIQMIEETVENICVPELPNIVLIAHGMLPEQDNCEKDLIVCRNTLEINAVSPVLWAEAFTEKMHNTKDEAKLVLIGSVAGDRGRQSNYIYGAAKGLLERYCQGLQHRLILKNSYLRIVLIKPGPTATPMTENFAEKKRRTFASANDVAQIIVDNVTKGKFVVYAPKKWRIIMWVIRNLPYRIFNRLSI